jgi:hypothetical protein
MAARRFALRALPVLGIALAALLPCPARAQLPAVLNPGDHLEFIGADVDATLGPGCDGVVNGCGVDYGDLGATSPRMYVSSAVNAGVVGTTRSATGRLAHYFSLSPGPDHRIGAKLIGVVRWRGWLQADIGAYDNTSSSTIGVSIYDITDPATRVLVGNQMVHTGSVGGTISVPPIPNFIRDIGYAGFALSVNLQRGHSYMAAVEANCTSTSGLVGLFTAASYSTYGAGQPVLNDGFIEQRSMAITLDPDYLALIDELRGEFENHTHGYLTGRGVGQNNTEAVTSSPLQAAATTLADVSDDGDGEGGEPSALSVVTVAPDHVELAAHPAPGSGHVTLERRAGDTDWAGVAEVAANGSVADATVSPGVRYGYRLRRVVSGAESVSGELWLEVPGRVFFGVERIRPNPVAGNLRVTFALPGSAPATLTLFDVQGRVVMTREVGALGLGRHSIDWAAADGLANGIYMLRLTQGGSAVTTKVTMLR